MTQPTPSRSHRLAYAAAVLFLPAWAGVFGGELGSGAGEPHIWDKALHFIAYFVLSVLAATAVRDRRKMLWAMLGLIMMGAALELLQGAVGRDCSAWDELANTLGVVAGALSVHVALLVARKGSG
jgi:VanZ family protein